jgi:hypothetical protein
LAPPPWGIAKHSVAKRRKAGVGFALNKCNNESGKRTLRHPHADGEDFWVGRVFTPSVLRTSPPNTTREIRGAKLDFGIVGFGEDSSIGFCLQIQQWKSFMRSQRTALMGAS